MLTVTFHKIKWLNRIIITLNIKLFCCIHTAVSVSRNKVKESQRIVTRF